MRCVLTFMAAHYIDVLDVLASHLSINCSAIAAIALRGHMDLVLIPGEV